MPAMDSDATRNPKPRLETPSRREISFCWKEMLGCAFTGWEPADQAIERIIDRMERTP
jgi:hypothetical protein